MPGPAEPYGREGLPLNEARERLLKNIKPIKALTTVPLDEALGRVNAKPINAPVSIPGFRASIMDGYALGQHHQPSVGQQWSLHGRSAPGSPFDRVLNAGEAIRILTGAPLPEGAGWVLPQECVETSQTQLSLSAEVSDQPWIRAEDEECKAGDRLINPGLRLTPSQLGRLAGCGVATLEVHRKPRIGLLISGDELVPAGLERRPGAIWESNSTLLETILNSLHQVVHAKCVIPDQPE